MLAEALPSFANLGRPVVDQTGLSGRYDFLIEWAPDRSDLPPGDAGAPVDPQGPGFLEALHEQLGLKLESAKAPVWTLVIDHIERPSEN